MAAAGFAHIVFFTLKDGSKENIDALVEGCSTYLNDHPGTVYFSAGVMAEEMNRDVNDKDFHVALHVVFASKADHDAYQVHQRHVDFIEKFNTTWAKVRVFDSHVGG